MKDVFEQLRKEVLAYRRQEYPRLDESRIVSGTDEFIRLVREAMKSLAPITSPRPVAHELPVELARDPRFAQVTERLFASAAKDATDRAQRVAMIERNREERFRAFFSDTGVSEITIDALIARAKHDGGY